MPSSGFGIVILIANAYFCLRAYGDSSPRSVSILLDRHDDRRLKSLCLCVSFALHFGTASAIEGFRPICTATTVPY
jgi:hypothetical protein